MMSVCEPRCHHPPAICQTTLPGTTECPRQMGKKTYSISARRAHGRHHSDQDMFLERKGTWIEGNSEYSNSGNCAGPQASEGKRKKLGYKLCKTFMSGIFDPPPFKTSRRKRHEPNQ